MCQAFPHYGFSVEDLWDLLVMAKRESDSIRTHFGTPLYTFLSIHPHTFDANPRTIKGPLIHNTKTSGGERVGADV